MICFFMFTLHWLKKSISQYILTGAFIKGNLHPSAVEENQTSTVRSPNPPTRTAVALSSPIFPRPSPFNPDAHITKFQYHGCNIGGNDYMRCEGREKSKRERESRWNNMWEKSRSYIPCILVKNMRKKSSQTDRLWTFFVPCQYQPKSITMFE